MKSSKLLHPFKNKILWESILKSFLFALMTGAAAVFCLSLVFHILLQEPPMILLLSVGGTALVLGFIVRLILLFPTEKKVAKRVDELGLEERASTMVAYQKDPSEIADLQRKDAAKHIESTDTKQLHIHLRKWEWISCIVCICLAVTMVLLPQNIFAFGSEEDAAEAEQQQIIKDFIQSLREQVKESALSEELKEEVNDIIDDLEEDLEDADTELERAAEIDQAKREIDSLLKAALTKDKIGEALQNYELTQKLGEAVSDGDTERVSAELDALEELMNSDPSRIPELSETITNALNDSGCDSSDSLYTAFSDFAGNLADVNTEDPELSGKLEPIFDTAEEAILAALEMQNSIAEEKEKLDDSLSDAKDEVLGNEQSDEDQENSGGEQPEGEPSGEEPPEGEMSGGEAPEGNPPEGELPEGEAGQGGEGSEVATMTEEIYDPISGNVAYGEVFSAYYAEYLAALESGEVPEELQDIIDNYFSSLD